MLLLGTDVGGVTAYSGTRRCGLAAADSSLGEAAASLIRPVEAPAWGRWQVVRSLMVGILTVSANGVCLLTRCASHGTHVVCLPPPPPSPCPLPASQVHQPMPPARAPRPCHVRPWLHARRVHVRVGGHGGEKRQSGGAQNLLCPSPRVPPAGRRVRGRPHVSIWGGVGGGRGVAVAASAAAVIRRGRALDGRQWVVPVMC